MSKPITLADLKEALLPLIDSIKLLQLQNTSNTDQIFDIHRLTTDISTKLDALDQTVNAEKSSPRAAPTKLHGRKGAVKKTVKPKVAEEAEEDDELSKKPDNEETTDDESVQKPKKPVKKEEPVEHTDVAPKKGKPVKKEEPVEHTDVAPKKGKPVKKEEPVDEEKSKTKYNVMTYFQKMFAEDETNFYNVFTTSIRKKLDTNEALASLDVTSKQYNTARTKIYYAYLRDKCPAALEELKEKSKAA